MNDHGLQNSIWAPQGREVDSFRRAGDWICPSCGFSNFAWRKECFRCPPAPHTNGLTADGHPQASTDTINHISTSGQDNNHVRPPESLSNTVHSTQKEPGLSTSRWAPRNFRGRPKSDEVWTRTVPNPVRTSTPKPPDLGLPYEVQHYILAMMQRMLEEACFDLASRWIPQRLSDNRWDCPEAVELSTWRDILPAALPPNAIVPHHSHSLERTLADAVQIRNAAVHRHLCDNTEIRRMVVTAEDVMTMFADVTRRNKFHRLWIELNNWDRSTDPHTAKETLLLALQEISERPVDDMDWSPNSVSLQEITIIRDDYRHSEAEDHGEAMDLD